MCERDIKIPPCCAQKAGSACAAPTPRETNNYYSRQHRKGASPGCLCKGSCYCPDDCCCPHRGLTGRFADPCDMADCCPARPPKCRSCSPPPCEPFCRGCAKCHHVHHLRHAHDARLRRCTSPGGRHRSQSPPYCPPCRQPVCYPPVKCVDCCNDDGSGCVVDEYDLQTSERICYYPAPPPPQPKYCTCGSPNPCDCDLNNKRRQAITEAAPCCRRCGRKVYAAEKIMASGGAFHTACFSCYCCHKALEVTNVYDNQGEIYCKQCYAKYFGVTGYGYGSTLQSSL